MKSKLLIGVCLLASALDASALAPTATINFTFFMAGATAQKNTIINVLGGAAAEMPSWSSFNYPAVTAWCQPGTLDIFYDAAAGNNYRAYSCTLTNPAPGGLPSQFNGANILIHYRLLSGSWIGVGPVARAQAVTRMNVNGTCTQGTGTAPVPTTFPLANLYNTPSWLCTGTTTAVPDVGLSDQEPAIFVKNNAPNDGVPADSTQNAITPPDLLNLTVAPIQGVLMNVVGTKKLINAMQVVQGKAQTPATSVVADVDRPSVTSLQITSLLTANSGPYNTNWSNLVGPGDAHAVHVCRRISAVGTQIAANAFWLNYPCALTSNPPPIGPVFPTTAILTQAQCTANPSALGCYNGGSYTVMEANLISDMRTCVSNYNTATAAADNYAIGLLFTDNNPTSNAENWDFLKIDGVDPNIPNAVSGAYRFVTTETWQYRNATVAGVPPLTANGNTFALVTALFGQLAQPATLAVQNGFLALPENNFTPGVDGDNVWKGTSGGSMCTPPTLFF